MLKTASLIGLILYFAILLLVVLKEKKNSDVEDYFFAGRSLPFWALSITFIASWWGGGSALSTADLAFADGMGAFWYYGVPVLVATLLMGLGARAIRSVGYLTQGAMMEARYSRPVARLLALMILFFMLFSAASQMVAVGDFFGTFLGMGYEGGVLAGTLIVLVYSMFGGFRGVVLTDIIQFVLLLLSALAVFVVAMQECGGLAPIAEAAARSGKPEFMSLTAGAPKYLMYVITFGCSWMIQANVWQRISATRDTRDARRMTVMSFFIYIPLYLIVVLTGMAGIVLFDTLPKGGVVTALVESSMSPLLAAVVFVGISAAIMSTMDSLINTGAMTLVMDLLPAATMKRPVCACPGWPRWPSWPWASSSLCASAPSSRSPGSLRTSSPPVCSCRWSWPFSGGAAPAGAPCVPCSAVLPTACTIWPSSWGCLCPPSGRSNRPYR